jgi:DNA repair exonuclease SbcCD ATPase subunit
MSPVLLTKPLRRGTIRRFVLPARGRAGWDTGGRMNELVRVITEEELEYAARVVAIEQRKRNNAELQRELDELSDALNQFEQQYRTRLAGVHTEIDRLRNDINDYRDRIAYLRVRAASREAMPPDPPPTDDPNDEQPNFEQVSGTRKRPVVDRETMEELRGIYRDLAKRYHPDLATTEDDRHQREALMLRINDAYSSRNLAALQAIARETERDDPGFGLRPITQRLIWARLELGRLDEAAARIQAQMETLRASRTYDYWHSVELIDDAIERLSIDAKQKVDRLAAKLAEMVEAHDKLRARVEARERFRAISARRLHAS